MLRLFPGRTEADLVAWIIRHKRDLRQHYGRGQITGEELATEVVGRARQNLWQRMISWVRRKVLRWPVYTGEPWRLE